MDIHITLDSLLSDLVDAFSVQTVQTTRKSFKVSLFPSSH